MPSLEKNVAEAQRFAITADFLERLIEELGSELADTLQGILELKEQKAGFQPGKTPEDARRRLLSPLLVTTYPRDRRHALVKLRVELRRKLAAAIGPAVSAAVQLELVEDELEAMEGALAQAEADRATRERTGLYAGTARAVDELFARHRVEFSHWQAATPEQLSQIADILLRRRPN